MIQSCYSTAAIKGTPVTEFAPGKDEVMATREQVEAQRQEIEMMSKVKENKVFVEIDGIPEYRIGPLDVLEISSRVGEEVTHYPVTVDTRGRISYSFIDDLDVNGLSPSQLDYVLTERLSDYVRNPRIDVLVREFNSKSALIAGEFTSLRGTKHMTISKADGRIPLRGKTTVMDLLALAGGYAPDADMQSAKLLRGGKTYLLNIYDIIAKGDERLNVIIDDGDVVDIPELHIYGSRVYVMGEVVRQGVLDYRDSRDLLTAIALAGNVTSLANEQHTLIVRGYEPGKKPLIMMADVKALLRKGDLSQNVRLQNGDLVYVPRQHIGDINDWIANTIPLLDFLFYPNRYDEAYSTGRKINIE
jgi:polysaccharide export outer membrane protein